MGVLDLSAQTLKLWWIFLKSVDSRFKSCSSAVKSCSLFIILTLFGALLPNSGQSQTATPEYKIKAVFLFNFAQFVEWPETAFADEKSPFVIGVLGTDPFGKTLDETVEGEIIRDRKIEVRRYKTTNEIGNCHVLFISTSEMAKMDSIVASLKGRSILTVSDSEEFAKRGGMIRLYTDKNKIRMRINLEAARTQNLSISSKLLHLAEIVPAEKKP